MSALSDLSHGYPVERLVPGDPTGVRELSRALSLLAEVFADAARGLGRIEVEWDGDAAGRFDDEFGLQPGRFTGAARSFLSAAVALAEYAATLESAQGAASRARDLFEEGLRAAAASAGSLLGGSGPLDLLTSPAGREQRMAAVELLERVRADVDRVGCEAASTLRSAMEGTAEPMSMWQRAWNFLLAPPWDLNNERRDWAAGAAAGMLDTLILASNPLPIALWVGASIKPQVNAFERRLGADPTSGFHSAGAVIVPGALSGAAGTAAIATRVPTRLGTELISATKPVNSVPEFLFRAGSRSPRNFTPRPNVDVNGLSTFDSPDHSLFAPGKPVQVIQTNLFKDLYAVRDGSRGHYSIRPADDVLLNEWAESRGSDTVHPLTQELREAIVGTVRKPTRT